MTIKEHIKRLFFAAKFHKKRVKLHRGCNIGAGTIFEGENTIGRYSVFSGQIGLGSYIGSNSSVFGLIGRYCSIADGVKVVIGQHPTRKFISTHPAFFSTKKQAGFSYVSKQLFPENRNAHEGFPVVIGNDVWVGYGALILSGVNISDGAIIAAGSVVTKDVPPYAIVGGNPAKIIRYRFSEDQIATLCKTKWWNKDKMWIRKNAELFSDIDENLKLILSEGAD